METIKFLIIEDHPGVLMLLQVILEKKVMNCHVIVRKDGIGALEYLSAKTVDVIISDYWMPHMNGLTLLEILKTDARYIHMKDAQFFIVSAEYDKELIEDAKNLGVVEWYIKPINAGLMDSLLERLKNTGLNKDLKLTKGFWSMSIKKLQEKYRIIEALSIGIPGRTKTGFLLRDNHNSSQRYVCWGDGEFFTNPVMVK